MRRMTRAQAVTSLWMVRGGLGAKTGCGAYLGGKLPELTAEDSAQCTVQMCVRRLYSAIQYIGTSYTPQRQVRRESRVASSIGTYKVVA